MIGMFGKGWTKNYGLADRQGVWFATLRDLTPEHLVLGTRKVSQAGLQYPPSASRFRDFCLPKPEDFDLPSDADAWREANDNCHAPDHHGWSHRAVYLAGREAGWFNMRVCNNEFEQREIRKNFTAIYNGLINRLMAGKELEAVRALEDKTDRQEDHGAEELRRTMGKQGIDAKGGYAAFKKVREAL